MGRIIVTEFVTVDGVAEAPGGGEPFERGGWAFAAQRGAEGDAFKLQETRDSAALLLGRRTYEGFAKAWPPQRNEYADKFNSMPKYVVSSTLQDPEWTNSHVLGGDPVEAVRRLRDEVDGDIVIHGSLQLVQTLLEHDLVDQLRLMVFPFVVGDGKRLFGPTTATKRLRLTRTQELGDGVTLQVYATS